MKPSIENDEIKTLYQHVKLTEEEINQYGIFKHLLPDELEELKGTVFNLSLLLLKLDAYEPT